MLLSGLCAFKAGSYTLPALFSLPVPFACIHSANIYRGLAMYQALFQALGVELCEESSIVRCLLSANSLCFSHPLVGTYIGGRAPLW